MADDDWETVSVKPRKKGSREIEMLRARYASQRDILGQLAADAPSDHLAREYARVKGEVETALARLDTLEAPDSPHSRDTVQDRPVVRPVGEQGNWSAAELPASPMSHEASSLTSVSSEDRTRLFLIPFVGLILLLLLGYFVWRSISHRNDEPTRIVEQPVATSSSAAGTVPTAAPIQPEAVAELKISPSSQEFGSIQKGTRAARQYELVNRTGHAILFKVARSACRCIYYEYVDHLPVDGKGTLTVTIDGSRAKSGALRESIEVTGKADKKPLGTFEVVATIP